MTNQDNRPKFKVGQVVSVKFGRTRFGRYFYKIAKVSPNRPPCKPTAPHCYFMTGWKSALSENDLRALTKKEAGR